VIRPHLVPATGRAQERPPYCDLVIRGQSLRVVPSKRGAHGFAFFIVKHRPEHGVDELIEVGCPPYDALVEALTGLKGMLR
jgi:hypothetical protein